MLEHGWDSKVSVDQLGDDAMTADDPKKETGGRKFSPSDRPDQSDQSSQDAAKNKKPTHGVGLTEPLDESKESARHPEGQPTSRQATPSPDSEKLGAGPAIAEHSKDAKAPKDGRKPSAYAKR